MGRLRLVGKNLILDEFTQHMGQRDVAFLNASGDGRWNDECIVCETGQLTAGSAGPGDRGHAQGLGCLDAFEDIRRIAAGTDGDRDVSLAAVGEHLTGEEGFEPVVIGDAGDGGDIGGEGNGR